MHDETRTEEVDGKSHFPTGELGGGFSIPYLLVGTYLRYTD